MNVTEPPRPLSIPPQTPARAPELSIVTPAFQEEANLPLLYVRLAAALAPSVESWEWIVVDDGSTDGTSAAVAALAARDGRVRGLRLARNGGSHPAILHGLAAARGGAVLVLAADLQDPPEVCPQVVAAWRRGARIVWGVRRPARGASAEPDGPPGVRAAQGVQRAPASAALGLLRGLPGRLYHALLRHWRGASGLPPGGAGFVLVDRSVAVALLARRPPPVDVFAAVARVATVAPLPAAGMPGTVGALPALSAVGSLVSTTDAGAGVSSATIAYHRAPRRHGRSGWTLSKKLGFAVRSLTARV